MKKHNYYISLLLSFAALFASCTDDNTFEGQQGTPFSLYVRNGEMTESRVVDTDYMPNGAQIGVQLVKSGSTDLYLPATSNLLFTHSAASYGSWTASGTTYLNAAQAAAYAYYPYNADVTDFSAIPVASGTTDYMFGTSIGDVNDGSPQAIIYMQHALSAVRIAAKLGTASAMQIKSIKIEGAGYHATANLNAYTGALTGQAGNQPVSISYDTPLALTSTAQNIDFVLIPTGTEAPLTITVTDANDVEQTLTTEAVQLQVGTLHTIQLTADYGGSLSFESITVGDWGYSDEGYPVIQAGNYTVTLAGDITGIAFNNTVNGDGSVTITAVPVTANSSVSEAACSTGASCSQSQGLNGIRIITLTDISSDIVVTFAGVVSTE